MNNSLRSNNPSTYMSILKGLDPLGQVKHSRSEQHKNPISLRCWEIPASSIPHTHTLAKIPWECSCTGESLGVELGLKKNTIFLGKTWRLYPCHFSPGLIPLWTMGFSAWLKYCLVCHPKIVLNIQSDRLSFTARLYKYLANILTCVPSAYYFEALKNTSGQNMCPRSPVL